MSSVAQIEQMVRIARELGREIATGKEAREIYKHRRVQYADAEETLAKRLGAEPQARPGRLHRPRLIRHRAGSGRSPPTLLGHRSPNGTASAPPDLVLGGVRALRLDRFALDFGCCSDYMSRQVLSAVFPILKSEWTLTDSQLATLSGIVALMVGLLTFPLSMVADRWGRVRAWR